MRFPARLAHGSKQHVLAPFMLRVAQTTGRSGAKPLNLWCCQTGSNCRPLPYQFRATTRKALFLNEVEKHRTSGARVNVINIRGLP